MTPQGRQGPLIATLSLAMTVAVLLQVAFGALGPFLRDDLQISRTQLGALTTAMYVSAAVLSLPAGRWSDRKGARTPLLALFGGMAVSLVIVAAAPTYPLLIVGSLTCGFAIAIANPVTNMVIQRRVPPAAQGLVTGVKQAGIQVGVFAGSAVLPLVAAAAHWRVAVLTCLVICALGWVLTSVTLPAQARTLPTNALDRARADSLPRGTSWLTAYALAMGAGVSCASAYLPLFAVEEIGLAETTAGLTSALVGGVAVGARLGWGRLADRVQSTVRWGLPTMAVVAIASAVGLVVTTPSRSWLLWVAAALIGTSLAAWNGVAMLAIIRQAPSTVAGLASGVVVLGFYSGFALGPLLFGATVDASGRYALGWTMVAAWCGLAAGLAAVWRRVAFVVTS